MRVSPCSSVLCGIVLATGGVAELGSTALVPAGSATTNAVANSNKRENDMMASGKLGNDPWRFIVGAAPGARRRAQSFRVQPPHRPKNLFPPRPPCRAVSLAH